MPIITTQVHSYDNDDSLIVAIVSSNNLITLQYYATITDYQNNQAECEFNLTYEFLNEIFRISPCPKV